MRIKALQAVLVRQLEARVLQALPALLAAQCVLAELDCLLSLAACARDFGLTRPPGSYPQLTPPAHRDGVVSVLSRSYKTDTTTT